MTAVDDSVARADSADMNPYVNRHLYCIAEGQLREYGYITISLWGEEDTVYYDPPHILLDFPLMNGKGWTDSENDLGNVYSAVVGIEYINVGNASIKCDVVRKRLIDPDTGHQYYDSFWWYSNDGLIRNEFDYGVQVITDEQGDPIDSVRTTSVMRLIEM
jgi:hypothetical protein